ncbi:putative secreted protein (Por secretion system target) [Flavobacteriaceae bacterium MAR_2010_72]|nr:putative secreted protein (Por secretion system target) [Flavobacteriaceae bacterium MAR_2010_72]
MKKILFFTFLSVSFMSAQELTITNGSFTIKSGASLNVDGLVLSPSADHVLSNNNSITRSATPITANSNQSMARVYSLAMNSADFQGTMVFNYEDSDENGILDGDAVLEVKQAGQWMSYADSDGVDNSVTHTFASAIQFTDVTVSSSSATLTVNPVSDKLFVKVYPNPVVNEVHIVHQDAIEVILFNQLGQEVLKTSEKTIDFSNLSKGLYILQVNNSNNTNSNNFKIIKQ